MKQGVCGETRGKKDKDIGGDHDHLLIAYLVAECLIK